jgi:hypothetical protein
LLMVDMSTEGHPAAHGLSVNSLSFAASSNAYPCLAKVRAVGRPPLRSQNSSPISLVKPSKFSQIRVRRSSISAPSKFRTLGDDSMARKESVKRLASYEFQMRSVQPHFSQTKFQSSEIRFAFPSCTSLESWLEPPLTVLESLSEESSVKRTGVIRGCR